MKAFCGTLFVILFAVTSVDTVRAADDEKFDDFGITFTHSSDWTISVENKDGNKTITATSKSGTTVALVLLDPDVDPKTTQEVFQQSYKKAFEGKLVKDSEKPVKRKILGAEREGSTMAAKPAEKFEVKLDFYTFRTPSKKNILSVVLMTNSLEPEGPKAVEKLLGSLAESKK